MKLFKDGKNRYFFFMKDRLWKIYDEIPLRADGALGASVPGGRHEAERALLACPARIRAADPSQGLERTEADWQDARSHLRAVDRSGEHLVGDRARGQEHADQPGFAALEQAGRPLRARSRRSPRSRRRA